MQTDDYNLRKSVTIKKKVHLEKNGFEGLENNILNAFCYKI